MALIRPSADLRNNYNEISKLCHETGEPVFITKNGYNDLVLLSNDAYEEMQETKEERIERLISEEFDKRYENFEEFQKDVYEKIEQALKEVKEGKGRPLEEFCAEMEEKYGID